MNCDGSNPFSDNNPCDSDGLVFSLTSVENEHSEILPIDENYFYNFEWGQGPTHVLLELTTNLEGNNYIHWESDTEHCIVLFNDTVCSDVVNPQSVIVDGIANQTMGIWEEMIADTITIYAQFIDWCQLEHVDSLKIIVNNDF